MNKNYIKKDAAKDKVAVNNNKSLYVKVDIEEGDIEEEAYFTFVVKRTEKLSSAIYLVTTLLSDTEPLKWKLRKESLSLMSYITSSRNKVIDERNGVLSNLANSIPVIISFLSVARTGGLISEMNSNILTIEYQFLMDFMNKKNILNSKSENIVSTLLDNKEDLDSTQNYKGHNSVLYNSVLKTGGTMSDSNHNGIYGNRGKHNVNKRHSHFTSASKIDDIPDNMTRAHRKKIILDLVKKKKEVSIKDISIVISDCSGKTIQRELTSLIKDNILNKKGEKRWSRYFLK